MTIVHQLGGLFAPWQNLYADSTAVSIAVTTIHIVSLLVAGGLAIAADRMTLRALRYPALDRRIQLAELRAVHRPVIAALAILFVSGMLLAAADIEVFATSIAFWIKMGLVALLLANGAALYRAEAKLYHTQATLESDQLAPLERRWRRLGLHARASMGLWLLTAIAGTILTGAA